MKRQIIKHYVVTSALGLLLLSSVLHAEDPAVIGGPRRLVPVPTRDYVMASPRACLIAPPLWSEEAYWLPSGDAENFPRKNGALRIPVGTRIRFSLSRQLEGVWYKGAYGMLATSLELQWCPTCKVDTTSEAGKTVNDDIILPPDESPWKTIGKDGARDVRRGPSIGLGDVRVPVRFVRPGIYYLRGIIKTQAQAHYPRPLEPWYERLVVGDDAILPEVPTQRDRDVVHVTVHVVAQPEPREEPIEDPSENPDEAVEAVMPNELDSGEMPVLDAEIDGEELTVWTQND